MSASQFCCQDYIFNSGKRLGKHQQMPLWSPLEVTGHRVSRVLSRVVSTTDSVVSRVLNLPVTLTGWYRAGWVWPGALLLAWDSIHLSLYGTGTSSSLRGEKNTWVHAAGSVSIDANWLGVGGNELPQTWKPWRTRC